MTVSVGYVPFDNQGETVECPFTLVVPMALAKQIMDVLEPELTGSSSDPARDVYDYLEVNYLVRADYDDFDGAFVCNFVAEEVSTFFGALAKI